MEKLQKENLIVEKEKYSCEKSLLKYQIISFDIFDTLLLRAVEKPEDIFAIAWNKAKEKEITLTDIMPNEFKRLRIRAEAKARKKNFEREILLSEIYEELPPYIVKDKEMMQRLEVETEIEYCYPNFKCLDLVEELVRNRKKVVLLSDMYLTKTQIGEIFRGNDIDINLFDNILISSEQSCKKENGQLFEILFSLYPSNKKEDMIHIGDNRNSDFVQAVKSGIAAFHYDAIPDKLFSIYEYEKIRHSVPQKTLLSLRKIAGYNKKRKNAVAYEIGTGIMGPVLTLYISHVCERLQELGIFRIYPFMREGYLLGELLKKEAKDREIDLLVKPIYISRKVTYIPSISTINREEIEDMIGTRNLTLEESIRLIGLDTKNFSELAEYRNVFWKTSHTISFHNTTLKEYVIGKFLERQNIEKIENFVKEQRRLLCGYLKQEIGDLENAATIDIGFLGRIQIWTEQALNIEKIQHRMKHFLAVGVTGDKVSDGIDFEGYFGTLTENMDLITIIHRTTDVLEKLISVEEGSTIGYAECDGVIKPIKSEGTNNKEFLDEVFAGILEFQEVFFRFRRLKPMLAKQCMERRRETLMILHRLIDMPRLCEVLEIGDREADTNFGTEYKKSIITEENKQLLESKGCDYIDKCNVSYTYENSNIVWPKGLITLKDEFYYVRKSLHNNAANEIIGQMQKVIEKVKENGIEEISLYGAGENGRQFLFLCNLNQLGVNCFVDRKESLWGTTKERIPIMGLQEAIANKSCNFIITSLFSIDEIRNYILENWNKDETPGIFSV